MGAWILLTFVSGAALYLAITLNKPTLVLATAIATGLGVMMVILRIFVGQRMKRAPGRR